jgi:hypothetical protein
MKAAVMNDIRKKSDGKRKYEIKKGRGSKELRREETKKGRGSKDLRREEKLGNKKGR